MNGRSEDGIIVERGIRWPSGMLKSIRRYPWAALVEVGDSFFVPEPDRVEACRIARSVRGSAPWQTKRTGRRFGVRTVSGGVRCWLIKIPVQS